MPEFIEVRAQGVDRLGPLLHDLLAGAKRHRPGLLGRGFVYTEGGPGGPAPYNAVSAPFRAAELAEPVVFTCGALPDAAEAARMQAEVGPKLAEAVQTLERLTGQPPTMTRTTT